MGLLAPLALSVLGGCTSLQGSRAADTPVYQGELFKTTAPFSRTYAGAAVEVCESARQALLSQGYVITGQGGLTLAARKFFAPEQGVTVELAFSITCIAATPSAQATLFATAWQDHFVVKKNPGSASLGVNAVGSVSLPLGSMEDSLVKVGVQMVTDPGFYQRFYTLVDSYRSAGAAPAAPR